jgi:alpha-1,3-rhamnosyl/mannosyltransferase
MQSLRKRYALPDQYFLYLGTLEPRKNIRSAVLAHQLLDDDVRQRFPLILAGKYGWKSASLLRMIRKDPYVQWIGYVAEAEKAPLLAGATALVFPSLYEGYGYPVAEAAALGTPVITSNRSSLPEVAPPGTYFISPYRIEHIRDAYIHSIS